MSSFASIGTSVLAATMAWFWQLAATESLLRQPPVLSALIAAGIGLVIFAATQWVLHCREKTSLLLEKLEQLYKTTSSLANLSVERMDYFSCPQSHEALLKVKGVELTDEITMLQEFYFPQLSARVIRTKELNRSALALLAGPSRASDKKEIRAALTELDNSIAGTLGIICTNQKSYTKARWYHYIPIARLLP